MHSLINGFPQTASRRNAEHLHSRERRAIEQSDLYVLKVTVIEFFRLIWMKKEFEDAVTFLWRFSHGIEKKKKKNTKNSKNKDLLVP